MFYNNINGYSLKKESLERIIPSIDPDIIALCETKKSNGMKEEELKNYEIIERNVRQGKEGLMVGVRLGSFKDMDEVTDTELKNILTVKVKYPNVTLRIIVVHAPQETESDELREEFFDELNVQLERGLESEDKVMLVGDLNGRVIKEDGILCPGANSPNGKRICEIVQKYELTVGNFHQNSSGKWTRIQGNKNGKVSKSTLDYVLVSADMDNSLKSFDIDEDKLFCPYRVKIERGVRKVTYSDHCAIVAEFDIDTGFCKPQRVKYQVWNFRDEEGMAKYIENTKVELEINRDTNGSTTMLYQNWVDEFEKLLSRCFSKRTVKEGTVRDVNRKNGKNKNVRSVLAQCAKRGKIQRSVTKIYMKRLIEMESALAARERAARLKKTISNLTTEEKLSPVAYWKMKKSVRKRKIVDGSIIMKSNGIQLTGKEAVKGAYKNEFQERMANRKPAPGWEEYVMETNSKIRKWLDGSSEASPPFKLEEIQKSVSSLKADKSPGVDGYPPEVFKKAGDGLLKSLLIVFNEIKTTKEIPEQWDLVRIVAIYKQKGSKKLLKYYRGIFLVIIVCKTFEKLIKMRIEDNLRKINLLQAGSRNNRGGPDNVYLFRGAIDHHKFTRKPLFITTYDFETAFDSLWLEDCILSLQKLGVEKEMLQLIYNLNKRAKVMVKTPFGDTTVFTTDPVVKQGTVLGPVLCSSSTGEYCADNVGVSIGTLLLATLLYVDDIIDLSGSTEDCEISHNNAILFSLRKKLRYALTKCYNMIINEDRVEELPFLPIDEENNVLTAHEMAYLGDVFNSQGDNTGLVNDRIKRGTKAMVSIAALLGETEVGVHKVSLMLLLYRALFLSAILFNSQTWSKLRKKDIDSLQRLQLRFLKRVVGVAASTANSFIFLELGVLPIQYEIEIRQLMFLHRILNLNEDDPVHKMFENQVRMAEAGEENWWSGVKILLPKYNITVTQDEIKNMSKAKFRWMVKKEVERVAFEHLQLECSNLKKTVNLKYEKLQLQPYLRKLYPNQSKILFKIRSCTLDIKSHSSYKYKDLVCRRCGKEEETVEHVINCSKENIRVRDVTEIHDFDASERTDILAMIYRIHEFLDEYSS